LGDLGDVEWGIENYEGLSIDYLLLIIDYLTRVVGFLVDFWGNDG